MAFYLNLFLVFFVCAFNEIAFANDTVEPVKVELLNEEESIQPGRPFWVIVRFEIADHWHTYWKNPGATGAPTSIQWTLPKGFQAGPLQWPMPQRFNVDGLVSYGYEREALFLTQIIPPASLSDLSKAEIEANIRWVVCSDSHCVPGDADLKIALPVVASAPKVNGTATALFAKARNNPIANDSPDDIAIANEIPRTATDVESEDLPLANLPDQGEASLGFIWALIFAFIGGMILNLMPCVLPVVSCKILSFVKMAGQNRALTFQHGVAFAGGVLVSFWVLAGALLVLQTYGHAVGWGFQLQEPLFVAILSAVFLVFGLSLFGVFELGMSVTSWAGQAQSEVVKPESKTSSFFSGILATAVATPCTGPFLGSAVGFAVTLSAPLAMLIFTSLGLGMAFPYLLLSAYPALLKFMPKPGNWMVTFKELMGFLMLATVLWLVWVFGAQTNSLSIFFLLAAFFFLSLGSWIYGKWGTPTQSRTCRFTSYLFSGSCLVLAIAAMLYAVSPEIANSEEPTHPAKASEVALVDAWEPFSPERVAELRKKGIPVFIDFTAKWCLICQTNHVILSNSKVHDKMREIGVVRMKADWTKRDPVITEALKKYGRNSLPLYVLYSNDGSQSPKILPQVLTPELVLEYLNTIETDTIAERDVH